MKLAVIGNVEGLAAVRRAFLAYHMALGQHLVSDRAYFNFYERERERGAFIIVDNGASERDETPFFAIAQMAYELGADEVVLPDCVGDKDKTLELTLSERNYKLLGARQRFVVPQGATIEEWKECCLTILSNIEVATIGLVRYLSQYEHNGRVKMAYWLREQRIASRVNIHALGLRHKPLWEASELARVKFIRGIDTALPIAMAQHKQPLHPEKRFSLDWERPVDLPLAWKNINDLKELCNG